MYGNTISNNTYSSHVYQNNNQSVSDLMAVSSRHMSNATSTSQQQQQIKSRNPVSNQAVNSTVTRFPPTLNSLNGSSNVIQVAANSNTLNTVHNNVNNLMPVNNRQQQHRSNFIQSGGEIIDLSSPPHSPQHSMYNASNTIPSVLNSSHNHPNLPPLQRISDASQLMTNTMPQYQVSLFYLLVHVSKFFCLFLFFLILEW